MYLQPETQVTWGTIVTTIVGLLGELEGLPFSLYSD